MTTGALPTLMPNNVSNSVAGRRRNVPIGGSDFGIPKSDSGKAKLFLFAACLWPIFILSLFASSAPHYDSSGSTGADGRQLQRPGPPQGDGEFIHVNNILDRVDILGYGPTHPRVAVVIVGSDKENLLASLESVFHFTDMNRIFIVAVVVDGHEEDAKFAAELTKIDSGQIPHWHGSHPDIHQPGDSAVAEEDPHGKKVHVIFNPQPVGVSESRQDAVQFIEILQRHHEEAGLKSPHEDLILLLLQSGAQLTSTKWLAPVTQALIVPPPIIGREDPNVAMKLANAVSFNLEGPNKRTSFDMTFTKHMDSEPTAEQINESSGMSWPTPALNGAAVAMRLETYLHLPSQDISLAEEWPADLDLALNLWLCADGIDILRDVDVISMKQVPAAPLGPRMAARFAAAWMDAVTSKKFFNAYTKVYDDVTWLEWEKLMSQARTSDTFTRDLPKKCRSINWYAEHVNPDFTDLLTESAQIAQPVEVKKPTKEEGMPNVKAPGDKRPGDDSDEDFAIPQRTGDKKKPSKPLCDECLKIVQKAHEIDIAYEDVSGGHKEHPHLGAVGPDGKLGYVHDETALRKDPPVFSMKGEELKNACEKHDNNYRMLHDKVVVDFKADEEANKSGKRRDKIFCLVYTIDSGHPKIPAIRETWG